MQKYCIAKMKNKIFSFLLDENGHTVEIHCDSRDSQILLGNIYIGRVKNIAKNLNAAFVEIQPGVICYLPLDDVRGPIFTKKGTSSNLQQGDEVVVQIAREAIKTKAPSLTTGLCFQGKYVILEAGKKGIGVSKKLSEKQRQRLRELGEKCLKKLIETSNVPCEMSDSDRGGTADRKYEGYLENNSIVLRTNAADVPDELIEAELTEVFERYRQIKETAQYRTCYSCLHQTPALWLKRMLSLHYNEIESIIIEDTLLYEQARTYLQAEQPELAQRLGKYEDKLLPLEKLYSLEHRLSEALGERVWMKSGAYLIIQPTEALTVIDVNSGKNETGKKKEALALKVNLEAARETARQLRLRNLSGIIIVDFINMEEDTCRKQLMEELHRCLLQDPVQARVIDMTKLYLVEITRKKVERPLAECIKN